MSDRPADLAGPGVGDYDALERVLPQDYASLLSPRETQEAITAVKNCMEEGLCRELNLLPVTVPLIVDIGEVSVSVWPRVLSDMCRRKNIHVLE